jgi:hypothetical protein
MHGGKTPSGLASPNFKHGRYSKALPVRLLAAYDDARRDPELLSLGDEAALLQARIGELLGRVDTGDSQALWSRANDALHAMDNARRARDAFAHAAALADLRETIAGARRDWLAWNELQRTIEALRRVSESERKRLIDMRAMVTADEAMAFAAALVAVVQANVADPQQLQAIQAGMRRIFEARHGRAATG